MLIADQFRRRNLFCVLRKLSENVSKRKVGSFQDEIHILELASEWCNNMACDTTLQASNSILSWDKISRDDKTFFLIAACKNLVTLRIFRVHFYKKKTNLSTLENLHLFKAPQRIDFL